MPIGTTRADGFAAARTERHRRHGRGSSTRGGNPDRVPPFGPLMAWAQTVRRHAASRHVELDGQRDGGAARTPAPCHYRRIQTSVRKSGEDKMMEMTLEQPV